MWKWLRDEIEKNKKNGKRSFIYGHNIEFDWYGIVKGELLDPKINYVCQNPFIAIYNEKGYFFGHYGFLQNGTKRCGGDTRYT